MSGRGGGGGRGGRQGGGPARGGGGGRGERPGRAGGAGGGRQGWGGGRQGQGVDRDKPRGRPPQPPPAPPKREADDKGRDKRDDKARGQDRAGGDRKQSAPDVKAKRSAKAAPGAAEVAAPTSARARPGKAKQGGGAIEVGSTENKPELVETVAITPQLSSDRQVVLSLGADSDTGSPLPEIGAGDRLEVLAELELTTDANDPNHPGLVGHAYSYAPEVEATLLLAADASVTEAGAGRGIELAAPWRQAISHERHHGVVTFGDGAITVPREGLPWQGPARVNLVVSAAHPDATAGDVLLVGQNEKTPVVVQDMAGIRVLRFRPANAAVPAAVRQAGCLCSAVPVSKERVVVLSQELADLQAGERLAFRANLVTDAAGLGGPARISTRMFIGDSPSQDEPGGLAASCMTWKGNLSKYTGFNCLPAEGPMTSSKYGVATVRQAPGQTLYVNLVAVSAAPFGGTGAGDGLRIDTANSGLEVTRFPAAG